MEHTPLAQINCPHCGEQFPLEAAIEHELEHRIKQEYERKHAEKAHALQKKQEELSKVEAQVLKQQSELELSIERGVLKERKRLKQELEAEAQAGVSDRLESLMRQLKQRDNEVSTLKKEQISLLEQKAQLDRQQKDMELDVQRKLLEGRSKIIAETKKQEQEAAFLKIREQQELVQSLTEQLTDLKRKAEQGSVQSQGEIQETELEAILSQAFPRDQIQEVKKGQAGADILQHVMTPAGQPCGIIAYESKRTKAFNPNWIPKLKEDMRHHKAEIGVIVSEALPEEINGFGLIDGVWVCSFSHARGMSSVLRQGLIRLQQEKAFSLNKGDKMQQLYAYLTSYEFRQQMEAIVGGFTNMKEQLEKEKRSMKGIWARREKELERIIDGAVYMYGSIQGISGQAIKPILELEADN